jgi:Na+-driven multidrug efflux pump
MLGTQSIGKLLVRLSVPATVAMLVMALYNVVDTIFVGRGVGTVGSSSCCR